MKCTALWRDPLPSKQLEGVSDQHLVRNYGPQSNNPANSRVSEFRSRSFLSLPEATTAPVNTLIAALSEILSEGTQLSHT